MVFKQASDNVKAYDLTASVCCAILCVGKGRPAERRVGRALEGAGEAGGIQLRGVGRCLGIAG